MTINLHSCLLTVLRVSHSAVVRCIRITHSAVRYIDDHACVSCRCVIKRSGITAMDFLFPRNSIQPVEPHTLLTSDFVEQDDCKDHKITTWPHDNPSSARHFLMDVRLFSNCFSARCYWNVVRSLLFHILNIDRRA